LLDQIHAMHEVKTDAITPIVTTMTASIDDATAQVQALVDAKVNLKTALGANPSDGTATSIDICVNLLDRFVVVSTSNLYAICTISSFNGTCFTLNHLLQSGPDTFRSILL
ncbi:hypothetical protein V5O48_002107, partial [Marasmius crinis-equi]